MSPAWASAKLSLSEVEALDRRDLGDGAGELLQERGSVPHAVEAGAAGVAHDPVRLGRQRDGRRVAVEQQPPLDVAVLDGGAEHDRDAPALPGVGLAAQVAEAALRELEPRAVGLDGDERVARLEDPAVHHRRDGLAGRVPERLPEIGGLGVRVPVPLEVEADALAEDVGAQVLLEHPQHGRALLVREEVEHRHAVVRVAHLELDGPRRLEPVHAHGRGARDAEGDPALPLGLPGVHRQQLHEGGEGLVEPDAVPPRHGHQVAEPHVGQLVRDHVGDALELGVRGRRLVHEQRVLAEGDGAQVLHRAGGEVGDGEEIDLVARVGQPVVALEEVEREGADLEREAREVLLARHAPDAERRLADHDRLRRLQLADHEGHEIRGHPDACRRTRPPCARRRAALP